MMILGLRIAQCVLWACVPNVDLFLTLENVFSVECQSARTILNASLSMIVFYLANLRIVRETQTKVTT